MPIRVFINSLRPKGLGYIITFSVGFCVARSTVMGMREPR